MKADIGAPLDEEGRKERKSKHEIEEDAGKQQEKTGSRACTGGEGYKIQR